MTHFLWFCSDSSPCFLGYARVWPLILYLDWTQAATVCISSTYQMISHPTIDQICLKTHISSCTASLHQSPRFMIFWGQCWELTHLYVTEQATVRRRAILLPSAPHRATVAHCPHWFWLAGGANAKPVKTQGAFRSCQLRLGSACTLVQIRAPKS